MVRIHSPRPILSIKSVIYPTSFLHSEPRKPALPFSCPFRASAPASGSNGPGSFTCWFCFDRAYARSGGACRSWLGGGYLQLALGSDLRSLTLVFRNVPQSSLPSVRHRMASNVTDTPPRLHRRRCRSRHRAHPHSPRPIEHHLRD